MPQLNHFFPLYASNIFFKKLCYALFSDTCLWACAVTTGHMLLYKCEFMGCVLYKQKLMRWK